MDVKREPRGACKIYMIKSGSETDAVLLTKAAFDKKASDGEFADGPFRDSFGDGYGEPYNPFRQAFGKLKNGMLVFCELNKKLDKTGSKVI